MAERHVDHLLIGGGIASATCAATLRAEGATGSIVVAGRELDPPYHRPPATKDYLRGTAEKADALVHPEGFWADHDVELLTRTNVMALDPAARTAKVGKEEWTFGTALVATGAMVRRLDVEGNDLDGLHYVRALGNADAIRRDAQAAEQVVLVGGSYIGCEVAASLTQMGKRCTVVLLEDEPMERGFGVQAGRAVRGVLEAHGVEVLGGVEVERFTGEERVGAVVLKDGRELPAQLVVCGVGATPDVMLARRAGLPIGELGGVRCDAQLQVEGVEGVFAAGDMCEFHSVLHDAPMRIEHEDVAAKQGATAARNMLGAGAAHDAVPYFWTDLADWLTLEHVGGPVSWDQEVVKGELASGTGAVWYLRGGRPVACLSAGGAADLDRAREVIAARQPIAAYAF
ncbi:NAD(P)/FAD-dependent oxidoreductase [Conexibacter sp. SYSU D00693]|uniref:NAD(P)/FAD-dependent oxidoreductase n=1 Tax=Conexibacter sp. SYSU D00693 TaxID=2812560 RepID=UPI00196B9B87|nr:FAD-dependent oxidoreductase [Conexibacter sp. SYSU D00693]